MAQCRQGWHLTEEPAFTADRPTQAQQAQLTERVDLVAHYCDAVHNGRADDADDLREAIRDADDKLRQLGVRGHLPSPDLPAKRPPKRSTSRRQDAPNLPTRKVSKTTLGREFADRYRPSMFVTLTCDSYGRVHQEGTPVDPIAVGGVTVNLVSGDLLAARAGNSLDHVVALVVDVQRRFDNFHGDDLGRHNAGRSARVERRRPS